MMQPASSIMDQGGGYSDLTAPQGRKMCAGKRNVKRQPAVASSAWIDADVDAAAAGRDRERLLSLSLPGRRRSKSKRASGVVVASPSILSVSAPRPASADALTGLTNKWPLHATFLQAKFGPSAGKAR